MARVNGSDYTNYSAGYDFTALMGGTTEASGNLLSDYASIKNGSYTKLMKAYYGKQNAEGASTSGDTVQKLTLMRSSADSLKKSAEALCDESLWEKKKITKKNEETGEETEEEDYDWDAITKAVKSFVADYNAVVKQAGDSETKNVLRNAAWMTNMTDKTSNLLSKVGITVGKGNTLEVDEDALRKSNVATLKTLFAGYGSFADKVSQKADSISKAAANATAAAKKQGAMYTKNGNYSDNLSKLFSSVVDEKVGEKKEENIFDKYLKDDEKDDKSKDKK